MSFLFFGIEKASAATYYVKNGGNDSLDGMSDATAWAHSPGMIGWTGSATLTSGDTVYFRSQDIWQPASRSRLLVAVTGVTYNGDTYGTGTRAKFQAIGDGIATTVDIVSIPVSNVTFKGFEIDGQNFWNYGIWVGSTASTDISNITIDNCDVHHIMRMPGNDSGYWGYGIHVSSKAGMGIGSGANALTCEDGDATNPVVSSTAYTFVTEDIGKRFVINTAGTGFSKGSYTIIAISDGKAVLDKPCGADGALSNGSWWFKGITISNISIINNTVRNCGHEGIALYQAWGYPTNTTDTVLVRNNQVYDNQTGILICNETSNATVEYNNIYANRNQGVYVRVTFEVFDLYYPYPPINMIFRHNIFKDNNLTGMAIFSPSLKLTGSFYSNLFINNGRMVNSANYNDGSELNIGGYNGYNYGSSELYFYNNTFYTDTNPNTNLIGSVLVGVGSDTLAPATIVFKNNLVYVASSITQSNYRPIWDRWSLLDHSNNLIYRASSNTAVHVWTPGAEYDRDGTSSDLINWEPTAKKSIPAFTGGTLPNGFTGTYGVNMEPNTNYFKIITGDALNNGVALGSPYNTSIVTGVLRPQEGAYDIGAYEYQSEELVPQNYSIINFINLISNWLKTSTSSDLNVDNIVNTKDLGIMMSKWN